MEITGKIIAAETLQQGETENGNWSRIGFVIEEIDVQYPQRVYLRVRGTRAEEIAQVFEENGTKGLWTAHYSHNAHSFEKDGEQRWVNDVTCWKLETVKDA